MRHAPTPAPQQRLIQTDRLLSMTRTGLVPCPHDLAEPMLRGTSAPTYDWSGVHKRPYVKPVFSRGLRDVSCLVESWPKVRDAHGTFEAMLADANFMPALSLCGRQSHVENIGTERLSSSLSVGVWAEGAGERALVVRRYLTLRLQKYLACCGSDPHFTARKQLCQEGAHTATTTHAKRTSPSAPASWCYAQKQLCTTVGQRVAPWLALSRPGRQTRGSSSRASLLPGGTRRSRIH